MTDTPDIPGICERDIDLLLLEEIWANARFREWFISRCSTGSADFADLIEVQRSVTQSNGESDLEVAWKQTNGTVVRVLIENKVDAGFQRDQSDRYHERANNYVSSARCGAAWTVLVAPETYLGSKQDNHGFDMCLTYEEIRAWFSESALGPRGAYKAAVLTAAIQKSSLGYNPIADDAVSSFWQAYWELSVAEAPELAMNRPSGKPAGSTWIYFAPTGLPRDMWLVHKLPHGFVELTLCGAGDRVGEVRAALRPLLDADMAVDRAGKSTAIRITVPTINVGRSMNEQREAVLAGLSAARRFNAWMLQNREALLPLVAKPA